MVFRLLSDVKVVIVFEFMEKSQKGLDGVMVMLLEDFSIMYDVVGGKWEVLWFWQVYVVFDWLGNFYWILKEWCLDDGYDWFFFLFLEEVRC